MRQTTRWLTYHSPWSPSSAVQGLLKRFGIAAALVSVATLSGCSGGSEVTSPMPEPRSSASHPVAASTANTACHAVRFATALTPTGPVSFTGTVSGDLEGSVVIVFDEFHPMTGVTRVVAADAIWTITGGELAGTTFVTRLENRNVFLPNTSTVKNIGSLRELSGIGKVNVTYLGETSLETLATQLEFNGVICSA